MATKKKKSSGKHKKEIIKKHSHHKPLGKKTSAEERPEKKEAQKEETVSPEPQSPTLQNQARTLSDSANPLGSPVVASSGVVPEPDKGQKLPQPQSSQPQDQQLQSEPPQKNDNSLQSKSVPDMSGNTGQEVVAKSVEPPVDAPVDATQEPISTGGVIRDKEEQELGPESIEEPKNKRKWIFIAIGIIILVLAGGALWYFRENVIKKASLQGEITPSPVVSKVSPTPATDSAKMTIDKTAYNIKVLNGSGISGIAGRTRDLLEDEDFNVGEIGNAETSDYENTVIQAKESVPEEFLESLRDVLEESYVLDENEELDESEDVDVIVIVGSAKQS